MKIVQLKQNVKTTSGSSTPFAGTASRVATSFQTHSSGRLLGNRQTCQTCQTCQASAGFMQTKLSVAGAEDQYEQEADRVADQVMQMPTTGKTAPIDILQSRISLQTKSNTAVKPEATPSITRSIQDSCQGGQALSRSERSFFEPRFGVDFSHVRIHNNNRSSDVARSVNARAFTHKNHVVFGAGEYSPNTEGGKRLLAHELTHVIQQQNMPTDHRQIQCETADEALMRRSGIDTRGFDELWLEFTRLRSAGQNQAAIELVRPLLIRMNAQQAVTHAGALAFWLISINEQTLAVEAINELENGWWMRYIELGGQGVPSDLFGSGVLGSAVGPSAMIDRAESLAQQGSHGLALQLFATAHLFLIMQLEQLVAREREITSDQAGREIYPNSMLEMVMQSDQSRILNQRGRLLNVYPRLAAAAMEQGNVEQARELATHGDSLLAEIRTQSLLPVDLVGPSQMIPSGEINPQQVSSSDVGATGLPPTIVVFEDEHISAGVTEDEAAALPQPSPPLPRAEDRIVSTPPPFEGALVMQLVGLNYYHVRSQRHAITGSLASAVNYAEILFPTTGAAVTELLSGSRIEFVVAALGPKFELSDVRQRAVEDRPDLVGGRGTVLSRAGPNHFVRALFTTNAEAFFIPGGELQQTDQPALLERFITEQRTDSQQGRAGVSLEQIQQEVFDPIDRLIARGGENNIENAAEQLAVLNATAFALLPWATRAQYLQILIDSDPSREQERAIVEILKSIEDRSRFDAVVHQLQQADVWDDLVDQLDHEIWSLLVVVGERFGNREDFSAQRVVDLMLEARLLRPYPGIAIGPDGPEVSINAMAEIEEAGRSFIRFLGTTLDSIVMLITEPDKIIEGLAQLVRMVVIWKLADLGHVPSILTRAQMLSRVGLQIVNGLRGLEVLDEHIQGIVRRVKWALIWEIASLFIGVGEIRAAIEGIGIGQRIAALARFIRILGLSGRVVEGEQAVSQLVKLARVMRRTSTIMNTEDDIIRLISHLPEADVQRLGHAIQGIDIDDAGDLARLATSHPELSALAQRSLREIEAMQQLITKAGGLSDEVIRGFRNLRGRGLTPEDISEIVHLIPDNEGARFARALRSLEAIDDVPTSILRSVAQSALRMDAIQLYGARVYMATYRRAGGELTMLDGVFHALGNRRSSMTPTDFQHMLDDLAQGNSTRWRRLLESEPALRRQAPAASHTLLQRTPGPYTWDPVSRRYTRTGHGGSTEIVEVYADGRIRFWREQTDGTLTDEAVQYSIATHGSQPSPRGAMTLQSNHGIQDRWVEQHFSGHVESNDVPAILLTNSRTGSQHHAITSSQSTNAASRASDPLRSGPWDATYWEIRQALIDDHILAGIPQHYIDRLVAESDAVFLPFRNNPTFAHLFPASGAP